MKQVRIITELDHKMYLVDFVEEPMTLEDYINFEISILIESGRRIETISHSFEAKTFVIIYDLPTKSKLLWLKK